LSVVVDSSALAAIVLREPEGALYDQLLTHAERAVISLVNVHETRLVLSRHWDQETARKLDRIMDAYELVRIPFDALQAELAWESFHRFGKGRHHARLNLCDCAAYALAKSMNAPLLFKGDDFARTDVIAAI